MKKKENDFDFFLNAFQNSNASKYWKVMLTGFYRGNII